MLMVGTVRVHIHDFLQASIKLSCLILTDKSGYLQALELECMLRYIDCISIII